MKVDFWFISCLLKEIKVSYGVCPRVNIQVHIRWMSLVTLICEMYNKHLPDYQYIRSWKINRHGFRFVLYLDIGKNVYQGSSEQGKVLSPVSLALFLWGFQLVNETPVFMCLNFHTCVLLLLLLILLYSVELYQYLWFVLLSSLLHH